MIVKDESVERTIENKEEVLFSKINNNVAKRCVKS